MKEWKKPEVSRSSVEKYFGECSANELTEINGGVKIGVCAVVGLGGNTETYHSGVMLGVCYVVGI